MKIDGISWYLGAYPYRFEIWDFSYPPFFFIRILRALRIYPKPHPAAELRGVELDIGRYNCRHDSEDAHRVIRFTEAQLNGDLRSLGLDSRDVSYLARMLESECRRLKVTGEDWRLRTVRYLKRQEHDLLFDEVCAANPGRSVCVDGFGISIG